MLSLKNIEDPIPGFRVKRGKKHSLVKMFKLISFQQPVCRLRWAKHFQKFSFCTLKTADWLLKAHKFKHLYQKTLFTPFYHAISVQNVDNYFRFEVHVSGNEHIPP